MKKSSQAFESELACSQKIFSRRIQKLLDSAGENQGNYMKKII